MNLQNPRRTRVKREGEEGGALALSGLRTDALAPARAPTVSSGICHAACRSGNYQESQERAVRQIWTTVGTAIKIVRAVMTTFSQRVVAVCRSVALLMVLDGDPQAVHGIAAGPAARDVVSMVVTRSRAYIAKRGRGGRRVAAWRAAGRSAGGCGGFPIQ